MSVKVHLRLVEIHRQTLRVVTLRPATAVRFSTNFFHDTWHIVTSHAGAQLHRDIAVAVRFAAPDNL